SGPPPGFAGTPDRSPDVDPVETAAAVAGGGFAPAPPPAVPARTIPCIVFPAGSERSRLPPPAPAHPRSTRTRPAKRPGTGDGVFRSHQQLGTANPAGVCEHSRPRLRAL